MGVGLVKVTVKKLRQTKRVTVTTGFVPNHAAFTLFKAHQSSVKILECLLQGLGR